MMQVLLNAVLIGSTFLIYSMSFNLQGTFAGENQRTGVVSMKQVNAMMSKFGHLPNYCQVRLTEREFVNHGQAIPHQFARVRDKWLKRVGNAWYSSHHLCWGIEKFQTASAMNSSDPSRTHKLKSVISELNYVRNAIRARGNSYYGLWPELLMYEYQTYIMLNRFDLANRTQREMARYKHQKKR